MMILTVKDIVACVASVSVGFSAGLKHFSLFGRAKIWAGERNSIRLTSFPRISIFCTCPNFCAAKKHKMLTGGNACFAG